MKRYLSALFALLAIGLSGPAWAQDAGETARKVTLAKRYMELADVTKSVTRLTEAMTDAMPIEDEVPAPVAKAMRESAVESMQAIMPKLIDRYAVLYAEAFTLQELEGIVTFYESPTGRAMVQKNAQLTNTSSEIIEKELGEAFAQDMLARLCDKIDCNTRANKRALRKLWG